MCALAASPRGGAAGEALSALIADAAGAFVHAGDAADAGEAVAGDDGDASGDAAVAQWTAVAALLAGSAAAPPPPPPPPPPRAPMAEFARFQLTLALFAFRREADFFLARPPLQLAALGSLRDANRFRDAAVAAVAAASSGGGDAGGADAAHWALAAALGLPPLRDLPPLRAKEALETPLGNFVAFLLETLQRDAKPLFELLLAKYEPALARAGAEAGAAGALQPYVEAIGARFFDIKPPQSGMEAMLANLFGGGGLPAAPARPALAGGGRR